METSSRESLRSFLLSEVRRFVHNASQIPGVIRIALIGSLLTNKPSPKDADLLVTIDSEIDMDSLAAAGRRLEGMCQSRSSGADIFLCDSEGEYLGRTCSWKQCHPRMACLGTQCGTGVRIRNDFDVIRLDTELILQPPLELWPTIVRRGEIPRDVERVLIE